MRHPSSLVALFFLSTAYFYIALDVSSEVHTVLNDQVVVTRLV